MADQKITQLTADTAPTTDDLVVTVNDPGGTPANRKVTVANMMNQALVKNPYKFSVYRSAATNSTNGSGAVIPFDTALFDTGSNVDIVTNFGRFTAPIAGFYWFNALAGNSLATNTTMVTFLAKNGTNVKYGNMTFPTNANLRSGVSGLLQLAQSDYVEAWFIGGGGSVMAVGATDCYFEGYIVSVT